MDFTSFDGIEPGKIEDKSDLFECVLENYPDYIYETKKEYEHEKDEYEGIEFSFKYKYMIQIKGYGEYFQDDENFDQENSFGAAVYLVISPENLSCKNKYKIAECMGSEDKLSYSDIVEYGSGVMMGHTEGIYRGEEFDGFSEDDIPKVVNLIANCLDGYEMIRGFRMDKPFNAVGWTGWTTIHELLGISEALEAKQMKEEYLSVSN